MEKRQESKMLDLMAIVAHELKSPVATIHTTADTLCGGYFGKLAPEQLRGLETILRNCQYLEDIIRCYSDLARIELDEIPFSRAPVDLVSDVVEPIVMTAEYQGNLKKMRIVVDRSAAPTILGDAGLLRIATNNLLNNAIKFGTPGSEVRVGVAQRDDWALLTVHNIGPGISARDIEHRLFKRFERLRQKGTEGVKGSGLGLYICKQIVERHGGEISVISDAESYVEFRIALKRV